MSVDLHIQLNNARDAYKQVVAKFDEQHKVNYDLLQENGRLVVENKSLSEALAKAQQEIAALRDSQHWVAA